MNKVIVLDLKFKFGEMEDVIYPTVLIDDTNMILIDCGYTGFLPIIEQEMEKNKLNCADLTHVLITHQDHDHMGALYDLKQKYPHIKVIASKKESPYISGRIKNLRLKQAEEMQPYLPEEQKAFGLAFCNILKSVQPVEVDFEVQDGDYFDWCGGCTILETPGHTPGHISVYVNQKKIIITGDAAVIENGEIVIANPQYTLDPKEAEVSLKKIMKYDAKKIICYHGGIFIF
ncbi:MBL fold metallo-hydrolase [Lachnoclostridium phytofermentans]|uniref:Beta-lactamase domain protein n=1 Tax=Lachnoclostridium phytofermentans (strain ATCC 700394 / DSM 18823 / ISDg) TaxID=357809 RepID=A9KSD3_LACP7|nr:MBL fold metallo-hydrolase [Lachnoclostridium phytofermentans]ABX42165.1 beta-lactamase domain protein [Lachnoclostridium phytofermentans ISDg]